MHIHRRKEIENYLLVPSVLQGALANRLREKARRTGTPVKPAPDIVALLGECMEHFRHDVFAQLLARFSEFKKRSAAHLDQATVNAELSRDFERRWSEPDGRESMVPGKEVLGRLNAKLQDEYGVTITDGQIAAQFSRNTTPADVADLLEMLQRFSATDPPEA